MYSPAPGPPANIGVYVTDEEIFMSLERMTTGSTLPENVTTDINPYQHRPSNLPDDIWYFIRTEQGRDSEHGSWDAIGETCEIFGNSMITGWKTTLEFYEGRPPHGQITNWVMQEYRIAYRGLHHNGNSKESALLCRIFLSSPNQYTQRKLGSVENSGRSHFHPRPQVVLVPQINSTTGQGSMNDSQARDMDYNARPLAANGGYLNIAIEDMLDIDYFARGDFLELNDLEDEESQSSSSDNTSCLTSSSNECFDSLALLQELEDQINPQEQGKDVNFKCSVAASVRPTKVVVRPPNLGSLISSNGSQPPADDREKKPLDRRDPKNDIKIRKEENGNEGTSSSRDARTSSSSNKPVPEGEKEDPVRRMKKLSKKYLCFMPF